MLDKCKRIYGALIIAGLAGVTSAAFAHDGTESTPKKGLYEGTVHGVISDSMCKFDHAGMIKGGYGKDAAGCIMKCVSQGYKLVVADEKNNVVYEFRNPQKAEPFAGKSVAISGHIDPQTKVIHIHDIKAE